MGAWFATISQIFNEYKHKVSVELNDKINKQLESNQISEYHKESQLDSIA